MAKNQQQQNNIKEQIFETVTTIVDESIKDLGYNITKICEVVDDSEAKYCKYKVKCGSLEMNVVDDTDVPEQYKEKDIVRVTIPNGNYNAKKVIEGLYSAGSHIKTIYVQPRNHFVPMSEVYSSSEKVSIELNKENIAKTQNLYNFSLNGLYTNNEKYFNSIYFKIINIFDKQYISGFYTLEIILSMGTLEDGTQNSYTHTINSTQLVGEPYSNLRFPQDFLITLKDLNNLTNIQINFIQEEEYKVLNSTEIEKGSLTFENIEIEIGHKYLGAETQSGLHLFTFDDLNYNFKNDDLQKNLKYIWYNADQNGNFKGLSTFSKNDLYVPQNLDDDLIAQAYSNIISSDSQKQLPRDEQGLKLVANYNVAQQIISKCSACLDNLAMNFQNFTKAFQEELFYFDKYTSYENINTRKMRYWYDVLNPICERLMGMGWTLGWSSSVFVDFFTNWMTKGEENQGIRYISLYAPKISDYTIDLVSGEKTTKAYDFFLNNTVQYANGVMADQVDRKTEFYAGELTNRHDGFYGFNSIAADNVCRSIENYLNIVKKFLIVRYHKSSDKNNQSWNNLPFDESYLNQYIDGEQIDIESCWQDTTITIRGRKECKYLINLFKDWQLIAYGVQGKWPYNCLHDRRVILYENILAWLQHYRDEIQKRNKSPFVIFKEELLTYHQKYSEVIKASVQIQQGHSSTNDYGNINFNFPQENIKNFYETQFQITNQSGREDENKSIKGYIELFYEIANVFVNDFQHSPTLGQIDKSMIEFYNSYLRPIVMNMEELNQHLENLKQCGYFVGEDNILNSQVKQYYIDSVNGDIDEEWSLSTGGKSGQFSIYLLESVEDKGIKNIITDEAEWKISYIADDLTMTMNTILPEINLKGHYYSNQFSDDFNINLEKYFLDFEKKYKLVLKLYKENQKIELIESNVLNFKNAINLNVLTTSQHIQISQHTSVLEGETALSGSSNSAIEFNIQCFDKDNINQKIFPYPLTDLRYPKLELFSYDVFDTVGIVTNNILRIQEKINTNGEITGISCSWNPDYYGQIIGAMPISFFSIGLRLWFNDNDYAEAFVPIPYATTKQLRLTGGAKILIYADKKVYFDSQNPYSLIDVSGEDLTLQSENYELLFLDRNNLQETNPLFLPIDIDENNKLIVNDMDYSSLYPFLPVLKATLTYLDQNNKQIQKSFFQPIFYFNENRFSSGYKNSSVREAIEETMDNIYTKEIDSNSGIIDFSCAYFKSDIVNSDETQPALYSRRYKNNNMTSIGNNFDLKYEGWARLSQTFPFFSFYNNNSQGKFYLDPSNEIPLQFSKNNSGIEFYYDGTIRLLKENLEPITISYQDLIDGTLGIQIQQIGVIQDDEIISTCN